MSENSVTLQERFTRKYKFKHFATMSDYVAAFYIHGNKVIIEK